jgi:hypothetical protein
MHKLSSERAPFGNSSLFFGRASALLFAGALLLAAGSSPAQSPSWTNHIFGGIDFAAASPGCARAVSGAKSQVKDPAGNLYITGCVSNGVNDDILTYKLNSDGAVQWKVSFNGGANGADAGHAIALDSAGNVVVTGYSNELSSAKDVRTIKYNGATGAEMWNVNHAGSAGGDDAGHALVIDADNHVYVTGFATGLGDGPNMLTIKYDGASGVPIWTKTYDGEATVGPAGADSSEAIALDPTGFVVVTGYSLDAAGNSIRTIKYHAATGNEVWNVAFAGTANGDDRGHAVVIDGAGNAIVAGYSNDSGAGQRMRVVKYNGVTGAFGWSASYGTADGPAAVLSMALDSANNVLVTGYSTGTGTGRDMRTVKYNGGTGAEVWKSVFNGAMNGQDESNAVVVDAANDVWVAGYSLDPSGGENVRTIKYNGSTGAEIMNSMRDSSTGDRAYALSLVTGDAAVVAWHGSDAGGGKRIVSTRIVAPTGSVTWNTTQPQTYARAGISGTRAVATGGGATVVTGFSHQTQGKNMMTARIDPATGNISWVRSFAGTGLTDDEGLAIAVNSAGRVAVTGYSSTLTPGGGTNSDIRVIVYDSAGNQIWTVAVPNGANGDDRGQAIAFDSANNVIVTGYITDAGGIRQIRTIKFDANTNTTLWTSSQGAGTGHSEGMSVAVDSSDAVIVTGYGTDAGSGENIRTFKLNGGTGALAWATTYSGSANGSDRGAAVALGKTSDVFVTGRSMENGVGGTYRTIKYNGATGAQFWSTGDGGVSASGGANALVVDLSGNVVVTGAGAPSSGVLGDITTIKYNGTSGAEMWRANHAGTAGMADVGNAIALASAGNVIVSGLSTDGTSVSNVRVVKYDGNSGAQTWSAGVSGGVGGIGAGTGVVVTQGNEIYVAGNSRFTGYPSAILVAKYLNPDVPDVPELTSSTSGNGTIQASFTPPVNTGGAPILDYTVTCGAQTATGTTSPITVTGLVNGTTYNCTIRARNANGSGPSVQLPPLTPTGGAQATLTVARAGVAPGVVTSSPGGINCGATCSASFSLGSNVTLTAALGAGATVTWSGTTCNGGVNTNATCVVSLMASFTVTATFAAAPKVQSDFNGDGRSDILWRNSATGMLYEMQMNGTTVGSTAVIDQETDLNWKVAAVADLNNDGRADVVWQNNATGQVYGLLMNGTTVASEGTIYVEPNTSWKIVGAGDFNGDGNADLLWKNNTTGDVFLLLLNGLNVVSGGVIYSEPNTNWVIQKVADFNGDGRADIVWRNTATGDVYMMLMNGTTVIGGGVIYSEPNTAWQIQAAADFSGDGRADVLWRNTTTGDVYMMLMNGTTITGGSVFYGEPNAAWKIVASGDYNGDNRADILWRNTSTGQVFMMLMNGFTISSGGFVYTEPDQNWKILGP